MAAPEDEELELPLEAEDISDGYEATTEDTSILHERISNVDGVGLRIQYTPLPLSAESSTSLRRTSCAKIGGESGSGLRGAL